MSTIQLEYCELYMAIVDQNTAQKAANKRFNQTKEQIVKEKVISRLLNYTINPVEEIKNVLYLRPGAVILRKSNLCPTGFNTVSLRENDIFREILHVV